MNTVKVGDKFEDKSYNLIVNAINNDEFGISKEFAKVYQKKPYYSRDREKNIIFDLSIEIWPKNAKRFTLLYLIECKSSNSKKVPVDDVEEFYSKINQVAGVNVKGVMVSDNSFQSGGLTFAKNKGMMLIEVEKTGEHSIILHRTEQENESIEENDTDINVYKLIKKALGLKKVENLKSLSAKQIESKAQKILDKFKFSNIGINISAFLEKLKSEYSLDFDLESKLESVNGKDILGYYDIKNNKILIDKSVIDTERFPFILGHELGHFFLHSELKINQEVYNDFGDSEYDFLLDKHTFTNDKHWIEWQANKFSTSLFLPKDLFKIRLTVFRKIREISRPEHIYLDNQPINQRDYYDTLEYLSKFFNISKTSIIYRMEELKLITYLKNKEHLRDIIRQSFYD